VGVSLLTFGTVRGEVGWVWLQQALGSRGSSGQG